MVQVFLLLLFLILGVGPSWAYEEVQVLHEGANSGKGFIEVGKPRSITFTLVTIPDPVYCGRISTETGGGMVVG